MAEATIYTTPTCVYCRAVKEFLAREKITYQEKNVAADQQAAQEMINRTGQMGVPVTILAGQTIIGFSQAALKAAVARLRQQQSLSAADTIKLGAAIADASPISGRPGAIIGKIKPGSLAMQAGLREGDVITKLNGQAIANTDSLVSVLQSIAASKIPNPVVTFWREGLEQVSHLPVHLDVPKN
ncbi:MAG: PDZ domain-containing protein [Chloroflexi bacterium]|nr:PDZ domain-containing protein [Chloroflexota bacterium]OJV88237.1 MAG: hypothetical protein BGO39_08600 [Chloroflexi bacterium 54-19]